MGVSVMMGLTFRWRREPPPIHSTAAATPLPSPSPPVSAFMLTTVGSDRFRCTDRFWEMTEVLTSQEELWLDGERRPPENAEVGQF